MHAGEAALTSGAEKHRDIPSLDGLRALSILAVVLAHSKWFLPTSLTRHSLYTLTIGNSRSGVTTFFIISGFLITRLLLREVGKTGNISLGRFYYRRSMRIFPAFYLYVLTIGLLLASHVLPSMPWKSFVASATYTWCYYPQASGYFLQHSWSLSIEEQFYLFWPAMLVMLRSQRRLMQAGWGLVVLMPLLRLAAQILVPSLRGLDYYLIYGWLDTMMIGCLLALANERQDFRVWKQRFVTWWVAALLGVLAYYLNPALVEALPRPYGGFYAIVIYPFTTAVAIAGVLSFVVDQPRSLAGRFLNLGWLRKIGVLSYSLYLWQQLFVSEHLHLLPWGWLLLALAAAVSFWLVEQPFLHLRNRMENAKQRRQTGLPATFAS